LPITFVAIQLIIFELTCVLYTTEYEFIVVNGQTKTSAFHKVV